MMYSNSGHILLYISNLDAARKVSHSEISTTYNPKKENVTIVRFAVSSTLAQTGGRDQ